MSMEKYITPLMFFGWHEITVSSEHPTVAKSILLSEEDRENAKFLVRQCLDPWRKLYPYPIIPLSWKRNEKLNSLVDGAVNSDHLFSTAVDFTVRGMPMEQVYGSILLRHFPFRQLIYYVKSNFIHWSVNIPGREYKGPSAWINWENLL